MAYFDSLKISLKQKWLLFFQNNRAWISRQMAVDSVKTPDGGRRPSSYLILGVISAFEPELAELMLPFTRLNSDVDTLIDVLELNFDPEMALNKNFTPTNPLGEPTQGEELLNTADQVVVVAPDDESVIVIDGTEANELSALSLDDMTDETVSEESKQEPLETPSTTQPEAAHDMFSEQWEQGNSSETGQAEYKTESGENKKSEDEEINRLFPNF